MLNYLKNLKAGMKFFWLMIILYLFLFFLNRDFFIFSIWSSIKDLIKLIPLLCFFFLLIFFINLLLKPEIIKRHLGADSGIKGWIYSFMGSVLISSPPYVILPMLKELKEHGMKNSLIALFMNNRNVQPAFVPVMAYYFGGNSL